MAGGLLSLARLRIIRRQLQQRAAGPVGQHIDGTVLKDAHVADPLIEIRQQRFLVDALAVFVQRQTENRLAGQATDQHAGPPLREEVAAIEDEAGRCDDWIPVISRLLEPLLLDDGVADLRAGIVDAVHDHRPAVVLALLDQIQLIATARTMFNFPQPSIGCEGQTLWRTMTHRPDFRWAKRRIAGRRFAFWRDVDHLAKVFVALLRLHRNRTAGRSVPKRDEQVAVLRIDGDAGTGLAQRSVG